MLEKVERYGPLVAALSFGVGILLGVSFPFGPVAAEGLDLVVDAYGIAAPFVIYFILAPSLLKMVRQEGPGGTKFTLYTTLWFSQVRIVACLFGIALVSVSYGLPLYNRGEHDLESTFLSAAAQLGKMMVASPYFYAIYASIVTCAVLCRHKSQWAEKFAKIPDLVEEFGKALTYIVPLFMLLVGIYVATIPSILQDYFRDYSGAAFGQVSLFGAHIHTSTAGGIFITYLSVALLTGLICTLWHLVLLFYARRKLGGLAIGSYFKNYFLRVYPLLWATSSEALATPLSMHLVKKYYPDLDESVRRFAVGFGSIININGTLICCFVMIPAVCMMLGVDISLSGLLLCLPAIYIIGFGVPGIPGELLLFAGPIMGMLAIPAELQPAFLLTFLGLQIGLPDSFRTGANLTDGCPAAFLLNDAYQRKFRSEEQVAVPVAAGRPRLALAPLGSTTAGLVPSTQNHCVIVEVAADAKESIEKILAESGVSYFMAPSAVQAVDALRTRFSQYSHVFLMGHDEGSFPWGQELAAFVFLNSLVRDPNSLAHMLEELGRGTVSFRQCLDLIHFLPLEGDR